MGFFIKTGIICKTTFIRNNSYLKFVCLFVFFAITLNIANVKISQNVILGMQFEVCSLHLNVRAAVLHYVISHTFCLCSCSMLKFTSCII